MGGTTRRQVIIGSVALALSPSGTPAAPVQQGSDDDLITLGLHLQQLGRRVRTLHRQMQSTDNTDTWQRWSDAHAHLSGLCDRIARTPATTLAGLAVRYEALAICLLDDDVLMDEDIRRQVLAFQRDIRQLARTPHR